MARRYVAALLLATTASARTIEVALRAPWPARSVSPLLEAAEFFAGEGDAAFWDFVDDLTTGFGDADARRKIDAAATALEY